MSQSATKSKVLVLSPHPDDGFLGAGGSIAKFLEEGREVYYVVFSWTGQGFSFEEIKCSIEALGIDEKHTIIWDYKVREFSEKRQAILEDLLKLRTTIAPDLVLCHSRADRHQDHEIVSREAFRAFKEVSVWGYELGWNLRDFKTDIFVALNKRHIDKKVEAINCCQSQKARRYYSPRRREAQAIFRAEQINRDYAEVFENINTIIQ